MHPHDWKDTEQFYSFLLQTLRLEVCMFKVTVQCKSISLMHAESFFSLLSEWRYIARENGTKLNFLKLGKSWGWKIEYSCSWVEKGVVIYLIHSRSLDLLPTLTDTVTDSSFECWNHNGGQIVNDTGGRTRMKSVMERWKSNMSLICRKEKR